MEGSGYGQAEGALGPGLLAQLGRAVDRGRVTRDDHLARRVDVRRRHHLALRGLAAGLLDGGEIQGEDGRHRAFAHRHRLLHVLATPAHGDHGLAQ